MPWPNQQSFSWVATKAASARPPSPVPLLDYFGANQTPTRAFDTEAPRGTLYRFHPDLTDRRRHAAADQMKIFDTLGSADAKVTVIDARAGLPSPTLQALNDIGFIELVKKARSPSRCSTSSVPRSTHSMKSPKPPRFVGDANYFLVKNHINEHPFFDWDSVTYNSYFNQIKNAQEITIPKLNEMASEQVDVATPFYVPFVANKNAKGEARRLFVRAARLCSPLARQCLGANSTGSSCSIRFHRNPKETSARSPVSASPSRAEARVPPPRVAHNRVHVPQ